LPTADLAFSAPATLHEALGELAGAEDVIAMGGGTSVGMLLKNDLIAPRKIVWLARIPELRLLAYRSDGPDSDRPGSDRPGSDRPGSDRPGSDRPGGGRDAGGELLIGATVTLRELARSEVIRQKFPALAYAASRVGNPRVRAVATVGGALTHSDARQDVPPIMYALQARVRIQSLQGSREIPVHDFHTGFMETVLAEDELVTQVVIPAVPGRRAAYGRFTPGSHDDYPTVSAAASIAADNSGRVTSAVLALGGVGSTPLLVGGAASLIGTVPGQAEVESAAAAAEAAASPHDDQRGSARYKKAMAREWAARVIRACLDPDATAVPDLVVG
jgi:carbon-monoxide dehydrogenase medium subunit